ncbi:hypothetical protein [Streptomyces sp. ADI98-10]|uniref:hypothetical protein n=1 Tax=Streptomyces sp. ADI98-10 TaxID=1522763 RepID=UPI001F14AC1E|nr:hypothetical protein [Streptomyces sp. ADI98-10]
MTLSVVGGLVVTGATVALVHALVQKTSETIARAEDRAASRYGDTTGPEDPEGWEEFEELEDSEEPEADEPAAETDATITTCTRDSLVNWMSADVKIVNGTDSTASYLVFVSFVDRDGEVVTEGLGATEDAVAPGATATVTAGGIGEVPAGTKCRIDRVVREAVSG